MPFELKTDIQYYHHGRCRVAGGVIPDAITAYRTYGDLKNPCIVFPTCFGAKLDGEFLADLDYFFCLMVRNGKLFTRPGLYRRRK